MSTITVLALIALTLGPTNAALPDEAAGWEALNAIVQTHDYPARGRFARKPLPDFAKQAKALEGALSVAKGTGAEPYVLFYHAHTLFELGRFQEALKGFKGLKTNFSKHGLVTLRNIGDPNSLSLVDDGIKDCEDEIRIRAKYTIEALPKAVIDPSTTVIFNTRLGSFSIQFYKSAAPKTVANFLKLVKEGFYTDTYVHEVRSLRTVTMGCPNTNRAAGVDKRDDGDGGLGYQLTMEPSDALHVTGAVAMRGDPGTGKTSGSQFVICVNDAPEYDNTQHVFGRITKGLEVVRLISQQVADDANNPYDVVWITSVEIR